MATLELCDLCGGKVKQDFIHLNMRGRLQVYKGNPPPPPEGFKYQEEEHEKGKNYIKVWDNYGKVIMEMNLLPKPPKWREIEMTYDLCESCAQKLMMLLEQLRSKYHLEKKEIKFLDNHKRVSPFHMLLGQDDSDSWKSTDEEDEDE